jgi:SHS2 domain-containing protein
VFEILEHTADIGFRARGSSKREMFASAALALQSVAVELDRVQPRFPYPIAVTGEDDESLLVNWLSEVLYYLDGRRVVMNRFLIDELSAGVVRGQGWGEPRDPARHPPKLVVKGVTYHQLRITKDTQGWFAEVYLDV